MMRPLFTAIAILISSIVHANDCHQHLTYQVQDKHEQVDQILCNEGYAVGYSYHYKSPVWVSYRLTKQSVTPNNGRGGNPFEVDTRIPKIHRATLWDYKYSGFDRGHLAPRSSMDSTPGLRDESFLLTNMTPQHPKMNQKGWAALEGYIRDLAEAHNEVFVITGALFDGINQTIGKGVGIPSDHFKVVYIPSLNKMVSFVIPNSPFVIDDLNNMQVKIDKVERQSGLQFFNELKNAIETPMEAEVIDYCDVLGAGSLKQSACN